MNLELKGLSYEEVRERRRAGLVNFTSIKPSKSIKNIIFENIFTYFNVVFLIIAIILILVKSFRDLTFLPIVVINSLIGIFQEIKAKMVLDKITVLNSPKARVIRDGKKEAIYVEKLVLDDVILLKSGDQIPADAKILEGEVGVNEALLTGEADEVIKMRGDDLLSGSFVVYGECYARLTKVGIDSYASQLTMKAKAIKHGEQSEIIRSLNGFVKLAGFAIVPIGMLLFLQQYFFDKAPAIIAVQSMVAAILGMIPEGLFLLASITLLLSVMRLAKAKVLLHDMKSIETLARVDMLCVDKTGTITSDKMNVVETIWLGSEEKNKELLPAMIGEVVANLNADNETMSALKRTFKRIKAFKMDNYSGYVGSIGFTSQYKYSGVQFEKAAFVVGAPEFVLKDNYIEYKEKIEKYTKKGLRVLIFGKYNSRLIQEGEKPQAKALTAKVIPFGMIILRNEIRDTAMETFKYFVDQGVEIKVISGDNPETVSEVAKQAGIIGANKFVDITILGSGKDFKKGVLENVILGRVTPSQKRRIINILKEAGRTVAMVGDGVNDVLALKDADCSIAMASGADAAVQASQVVLLESDFAKMPQIVSEGRQVVNNLQRSGSLFVVKNMFSFLMAVVAILFTVKYPLRPTQVSLVTMFTIGIPSFLLAQIPTNKIIQGKFMQNIIFSALPASIANLVLIINAAIMGNMLHLGFEITSTICTVVWATLGGVYLIDICKPMDKIKSGIVVLCVVGFIICSLFLQNLFAVHFSLNIIGWGILGLTMVLAFPVFAIAKKMVNKIKRSEKINLLIDKIKLTKFYTNR